MDTAAHATSTLTSLDWIMIALYFAVLATVAWWVVSKSKKTATDYFLAGRNLSWWIIGASIFASNIGPEHVVGLARRGGVGVRAGGHPGRLPLLPRLTRRASLRDRVNAGQVPDAELDRPAPVPQVGGPL